MNFAEIIKRLREESNPIRFVASRILARTGLSQLFNLKIQRSGYQLHFFDTALSMTLWLAADERSDDVKIVQSLLEPGAIYVDIGANIGDLVVAGARAVGGDGKVYAFEAHPRIFALMLKNFALNALTNISPVNAACGEDFGWTCFSDKRSDDMNQVGMGSIVVPVIPADKLLPAGDICLVKIDVEGFELFVLKGLIGSLSRTRHVLLEVGDQHFGQFGYRYADIHDLLTAQGFTIYAKAKQKGSKWVAIKQRDYPFPTVQNVIATRDLDLNGRFA